MPAASVVPGQFAYPHPEVGPQYIENTPGDAYPYGGTSVGDLRFPCLEFLACKTISGRFVDFDGMLSWFNDTLGETVTDTTGAPVTNGDYIRQTCYTILNLTSDEEIRLTVTEDRNEDGVLDEGDLDFIKNGDYYEAQYTLWQYEYVQDQTLWGWMDAPSTESYKFSTCDSTAGLQVVEYNQNYAGGAPLQDLLNFPSKHITKDDWVSSQGFVWSDWENDEPVIEFDFLVDDT